MTAMKDKMRSALGCPPPIPESSSSDSGELLSDGKYIPPARRSTAQQHVDNARQRRSQEFMRGGPKPKQDFHKGGKED